MKNAHYHEFVIVKWRIKVNELAYRGYEKKGGEFNRQNSRIALLLFNVLIKDEIDTLGGIVATRWACDEFR
jgi:hypothetical protein